MTIGLLLRHRLDHLNDRNPIVLQQFESFQKLSHVRTSFSVIVVFVNHYFEHFVVIDDGDVAVVVVIVGWVGACWCQ